MNSLRPGPIRRVLNVIYGLYAWLIFVLVALFCVLVGLVVPGAARRAKIAANATKAIFILTGTIPEINGLENLPEGDCIVVANHASYVDGFLLKGFLPWRFSFVIKGEMRDIPVAHFMLQRAGARFVERSQSTASSRDARMIVKAAQDGESLAFFPEGTFVAQAGIDRFRPGAFVAAIKGNMPIVPIAITGTRAMLPAGRILPRPVPIRFDILPPIGPGDAAFDNSRHLAEVARQHILALVNEPDLVAAKHEKAESATD